MVTDYPPGKPVHYKGQIIKLPVELIIGYVADPYLVGPRQDLASLRESSSGQAIYGGGSLDCRLRFEVIGKHGFVSLFFSGVTA